MDDMQRDLDAIDRLLSQEEVVRPSSEFTSRVMRQVRTEAHAPEPLEFPWRRFLPGMLTSLSLTLATFMVLGWFGADLPQEAQVLRASELTETLTALEAALSTPTGVGLACAGAALLLSVVAAWWATRTTVAPTRSF